MKARDFVLIVLLGAAVFVTQRRVDRALDALSRPAPSLWAGREVKRLVPGFEGLFADVYWLRTVQYYGGQRAYVAGSRYELLYPLIDITVTLDPRLELAYRYGATFLAEPRPAGAGEPEKAVAILERGVAAFPDNWRLRQYLGFIVFLFLHDSERAAKILNEAAELPGAASWLRTLAAELLLRGGERRRPGPCGRRCTSRERKATSRTMPGSGCSSWTLSTRRTRSPPPRQRSRSAPAESRPLSPRSEPSPGSAWSIRRASPSSMMRAKAW
jgi:tetratricopeptide (TPR) repeat protein